MPVYLKQTWVNGPGGNTPLSAERLQHIEDGIAAVETALDGAVTNEQARAEAAEQQSTVATDAETTRATAAEAALSGSITAETTRAQAAEASKSALVHTHTEADVASLMTDLAGKVPTNRQINGHPLSADVTVSKTDVGLGNVDNTSDVNKPVSTAQAAADALAIPLTQRGAVNGVATLDGGGKLPTAQLPPLAINDTFTVTSQAAMLALTAQRGDAAVRTDLSPAETFMLMTDDPTQLVNWVQITTAGAVTSVFGRTGAVALVKADVTGTGLGASDVGAPNVVVHGSNAATARPAGATVVHWIGSVAPTNAATNDEWSDTANKLLKRWNGTVFDAFGSGVYAPLPSGLAAISQHLKATAPQLAGQPPVLSWSTTSADVAAEFGWLNVTDPQWGLHCDGVTDDLTGFQALVTNQAGKTLWVPPGTVIALSGTVNLAKGTILRGNAVRQATATDATLLFNNTSDGLAAVDSGGGGTWRIIISGLSIQQQNTANLGAGIRTEKAWDVHIDHCNFQSVAGTNNNANWQVGIRKAHGLHNNIEDCSIQLRGPNSAACVWVSGIDGPSVIARSGFQLLTTSSNIIAPMVMEGSTTCRVTDCEGVQSVPTIPFVYLVNSHGVTFENNDMEGSSGIHCDWQQSALSVAAGLSNNGANNVVVCIQNLDLVGVSVAGGAPAVVGQLITIGNYGGGNSNGAAAMFTGLGNVTNFLSMLDVPPTGAALTDGSRATVGHVVTPITGGVTGRHFDALGNGVASRFVGGFAGTAPSAAVATVASGSTTSGNTTVTAGISFGGAGVLAGMGVTGAGIPAGATVVSTNGGSMVISQAATATASGVSLSFYNSYAAGDFGPDIVNGGFYTCTASGAPGTWAYIGPAGAVSGYAKSTLYKATGTAAVGLNGVYGAYTDFTPDAGSPNFVIQGVNVVWTGVSSETCQAQIKATFSDGTTATNQWPSTTTSQSQVLTDVMRYTLVKDGVTLQKISVQAKTTVAATAAVCTVQVFGTNAS